MLIGPEQSTSAFRSEGKSQTHSSLISELNSLRRSCRPLCPFNWRLIEPERLSERTDEEISLFPFQGVEPRLLGCQAPVLVTVR